MAELVGHTAIVYSAAVSPDGLMVATASEDGTARLWRLDGTLTQTVQHPGRWRGVWGVGNTQRGGHARVHGVVLVCTVWG